jgi:hypothetical protein
MYSVPYLSAITIVTVSGFRYNHYKGTALDGQHYLRSSGVFTGKISCPALIPNKLLRVATSSLWGLNTLHISPCRYMYFKFYVR